jgi:hypothetical protein
MKRQLSSDTLNQEAEIPDGLQETTIGILKEGRWKKSS